MSDVKPSLSAAPAPSRHREQFAEPLAELVEFRAPSHELSDDALIDSFVKAGEDRLLDELHSTAEAARSAAAAYRKKAESLDAFAQTLESRCEEEANRIEAHRALPVPTSGSKPSTGKSERRWSA